MDPSSLPPLRHLLLLLAFLSRLPASADRRFGCLFENDLCSPYEICVNDGMFGRCHSVPVKEVYTYDISPPVVQRFRMLLEKLSNRGLTWEDDTTQQVLSKELSKLRRIPYRPQQNGLVYNTNSRPVAEAMDPVDQRVKPVEVELSRNLQVYLQRLGLLPKTYSTAGLSAPGKGFQPAMPPDLYRSKALTSPQKSSPSSFSPLSSVQPLQKQRPPANQLLATQAEGDLLMGALRQYLSRYMSLHGGGVSPGEREGPLSRLRLYSGPKIESSKPRLLKMGRTQGAAVKDPLTSVDERFIEDVLKNVGRQHVDVDNLTPKDLDQLSRLIADALQVVDQDRGMNRGLTRVRPGPRDLEGELRDGEEEEEAAARDEEEEKLLANTPTLKPQGSTSAAPAALQERHTDTEEHNVKDKANTQSVPDSGDLFSKLLAYLDQSSVSSSPSARTQQVGLENVQSRTSEAGVTVQKKDATQSVEEVSEVEGWIKEVAPPPASLVYEEPHKKTMHVPELQLDVKASKKKADDDVFGYVITDTNKLQTDEGLHLIEILARRAKLQMTDLADFSVEGSAVTFKVRPNAQNISTADVANVAVQQKVALEKEAKLSILEAGVTDSNLSEG